jgi:hypothetical protein
VTPYLNNMVPYKYNLTFIQKVLISSDVAVYNLISVHFG